MELPSYHKLDKEHDGETGSPHGRTGITNEEIAQAEGQGLQVEKESSLFGMFGTVGIGAALRSVASSPTWSLSKGPLASPLHQLFSVPDPTSDKSHQDVDSPSSPLQNKEEECDFTKEQIDKAIDGYFRSNFHDLPLYQEYLVASVKADLQRVHQTGLADLVVSQCLPGLQCQSKSPSHATASPSSPRVKITCSLWQELPEVQEKGLLQMLTSRQIRQQETMFELLTSEASYLKSLRVAVNHFQSSKELRRTLSSVEHHTLFSNLCSVCGVSERFLADLEGHFLENVVMSQFGDIVLHHRVKLRQVYVPYVTNMMYQEALISKMMKENHRFVFVLHTLEKHPQCQRQSLKSFLVLPFQRITRLKLLLETILKLAEPDVLLSGSLTEAISALHEIVNECNRNVLFMKQTEELVRLERLVDFDQTKAIPLITHGRFLVHEGQLRQTNVRSCPTVGSVVSFSDVYMHLFTDLLLISTQKEGRFSVQDYALFPYNVHTEDIKTDVLGLPPASFLLHLTQSHTGAATALILVASTR